MDLSSIFREHFEGTKTGQLLIKFEGEKNLCKIHIENGNAVYISIGTKSPDETIIHIAGKKPVEANFIKGVPPIKRVSAPLNNRLKMLADTGSAGNTNLDFNARDSFESKSVHQQKPEGKKNAVSPVNVSLDFDAKDSFEKKPGSKRKNDDFPDIHANENITEG